MTGGAPRRLLALEAATEGLSVAIAFDGELAVLRTREGTRQHSSALLEVIDASLEEARLSLDAIDAMAVSSGPGSFTSLRIALATVKGLAFGRALPVVGVSTLEAMALAVLEGGGHGDCPVLALLDARRGDWYAGSWRREPSGEGLPRKCLEAGLYSPARLAEDLARAGAGPVVAVGPELAPQVAALAGAGLEVRDWISGPAARPRADWVARLGLRRLARGEGERAETLAARYLRRAQAEALRTGQAAEAGGGEPIRGV